MQTLSCMALIAAVFIHGPEVRKVVVNEAALSGRQTWSVTGLGVFRCWINGREVGAEDVLKPGFTQVEKRRQLFTYDITDFLNRGKGETNIFTAVTSGGWWSDEIVADKKKPQRKDGFYATGFVETDTTWECRKTTPLNAGIYEGERWDASVEMGPWEPATINDEFHGEISPVVGASICYREPIKVVKSWKVGNKTVWDFGQNHAGVPHFTLRGKPLSVFRYRLGEMLNDGIKDHHGDGPKDTVYFANLRGAAKDMWYKFGKAGGEVVYQPYYTFYGYRYLQVEDNPDVEVVAVESIPVTSVRPELERAMLTADDPALDRLIKNVYWGMCSNFISIPTDCPQRDERYGWTADTQVFSETACYFMDARGFYRKWMQDVRDTQFPSGAIPVLAPIGRWGCGEDMQAAWVDAMVVVPYRVWKAYGDLTIVEENWDAMTRFMEWCDTTGRAAKKGNWLLCDWLSYEKLTIDQRTSWQKGTCTEDHLSYQHFLNYCYMVSDARMMSEMAQALGKDGAIYADIEKRFTEKLLAGWFKADGSLVDLFEGMQTPRLMALKIGIGDTKRHLEELKTIIHNNGDRLATGFVGTSELLEQLSRYGEHTLAWTIVLQHAFPSWLYSVDQGATTVWERWDGYRKDKGFGDVGMNSYNHYAYGSVVGWLFKYGLNHPDPRVKIKLQ